MEARGCIGTSVKANIIGMTIEATAESCSRDCFNSLLSIIEISIGLSIITEWPSAWRGIPALNIRFAFRSFSAVDINTAIRRISLLKRLWNIQIVFTDNDLSCYIALSEIGVIITNRIHFIRRVSAYVTLSAVRSPVANYPRTDILAPQDN